MSTRASLWILLTAIAVLSLGCPSPHKTVTIGAAVYTPVSALTTAAWWIDPQNSSGCANDQNTGTSATCTGGLNGPLKSWYGLANANWGCTNVATCCPRLPQTTTVTFLSSHTDTTDPVYACAVLESPNGPSLIIQGVLGSTQLVATGTTGTVTAKNRNTPQPLATTFTLTSPDGGTAPTLVAGELVINTTHPSAAWINTVGSPNIMSQPLARYVLGTNTPAEVDTWANSDAVQIYTPVNVDIVQINGHVTEANTTSFANGIVLLDLNVADPNSGASFNLDSLQVIGDVGPVFAEAQVSRAVMVNNNGAVASSTAFVNADLPAKAVGSTYNTTAAVVIQGGQVRASAGINLRAAGIDKDFIVSGNSTVDTGSLGFIFIPSGKTLTVTGATAVSGTGVLYGAGTLNVGGSGRLSYPAGGGKAAAAFLQTGFTLNGQTKYLTQLPTSATGIVTGNTTLTAAALDASGGATTMCALGAGASICNAP